MMYNKKLSFIIKFYLTFDAFIEPVSRTKYNQQPARINLPQDCFETMLFHCRRKLLGEYLPGEDRNRKAFGLMAGRKENGAISVARCFPLLCNARQNEAHREYMDQMMAEHAIPSETPLSDRGWVAAPAELTKILERCREQELLLIGSYHMHRIAWPQDPIRDTPTKLDTILGSNSRLIMFIIAMVDPTNPILRAFDEGDPERELPIHYIAG
jgi:hypothetical protein